MHVFVRLIITAEPRLRIAREITLMQPTALTVAIYHGSSLHHRLALDTRPASVSVSVCQSNPFPPTPFTPAPPTRFPLLFLIHLIPANPRFPAPFLIHTLFCICFTLAKPRFPEPVLQWMEVGCREPVLGVSLCLSASTVYDVCLTMLCMCVCLPILCLRMIRRLYASTV